MYHYNINILVYLLIYLRMILNCIMDFDNIVLQNIIGYLYQPNYNVQFSNQKKKTSYFIINI